MSLKGTIVIDVRDTIKLGMLKNELKSSGEDHLNINFYPAGQGDFDEIINIIRGGIPIGPSVPKDNVVTFDCPGFGEVPGVPQRVKILWKGTEGQSFLLEKILGKDQTFLIKENERLRQKIEHLELALASKEKERVLQDQSIEKLVAKKQEAVKKPFNPLLPNGGLGFGGGHEYGGDDLQ